MGGNAECNACSGKNLVNAVQPDHLQHGIFCFHTGNLGHQLNDAYEALSAKPSETNAFSSVETALEEAEAGDGVNFQNYEFFEYWDYEEAKRNAESVLAAYQTPEAPDKYIDGSWLSEEKSMQLLMLPATLR